MTAALIWLVIGALSYLLLQWYLDFPPMGKQDKIFSVMCAVMGPCALCMILIAIMGHKEHR